MTAYHSHPAGRHSRILDASLRHADRWGMAWFGLIFWGSVLFATAQQVWPHGEAAVQLPIAATIGLVAGLAARRRGYWL